MSMGRARSVALVGVEGHLIEVEADIGQSLPAFILLGLPDASLRESQDRIRSAAKNTGLDLPARRLTVNLLPASLPKSGSALDLAILISAWAAQGLVVGTEDVVFLAELGLDGRLRPVRGVLPAVAAAARAGAVRFVVSRQNAAEAALVPGVEVLAASHAYEVAKGFAAPAGRDGGVDAVDRSRLPLDPDAGMDRHIGGAAAGLDTEDPGPGVADLADVRGQHQARFALEAAAAGGHHLLLMGAPGAGKTMLAERLPGILPPLCDDDAMEVTAIGSVTGQAGPVMRLTRRAPFESPHHSASTAAIVGGGARLARPGAVTRAHRGVLFLDEAPEFQRPTLDALRQPLETGAVTLHRAAGTVTYPARFQLVMAANPCPCGMAVGNGRDCSCTVLQRRSYLTRLSGPLLDRIDLQVQVERPRSASMALAQSGESSAEVLSRVVQARASQRERLAPWGMSTNGDLPLRLLTGQLRLDPHSTRALDACLDRAVLSLRGYVRVLRLAWTLADLVGLSLPGADEVDAAMQLRQTAEERRAA
ncbi:YifB family Mg chelatase-like AAA ATPase [Nesterenkonia xinjiangensis]|uniref:Magnesium chelatase family protein n=1 Tax=Nesterenkonia xinjiangensis TaxID=225327 RepID=A0A7Z0GPJ9_9MICC|nr:YifB family Mg chelatase-like AAA ATPase [Nesterenkonia xinjiangensis]NYJ79705.1 magnesium chelatase family protein [Nesterenkonia xinjiangensis]